MVKTSQIKKIVVATDGSKNAFRAGKLAIKIAKKTGSQLIVVSVIADPPYMIFGPRYFSTARRKWHEKWTDQILNLARSGGVNASAQILNLPRLSNLSWTLLQAKKLTYLLSELAGLELSSD